MTCMNETIFEVLPSYLGMSTGRDQESLALEVGLLGLMNDDLDAGGELTPGSGARSASVFVFFGVDNELEGMRAAGSIHVSTQTVAVERVTNTVFGVRCRKFCKMEGGKPIAQSLN